MTEHLDFLSAEYWDERYGGGQQWSGKPNAPLVAETAGLRPGSALDVGCGEGADAIWLAEQGWQVTATDISKVALDRAAGHAGGLDIKWVQADLLHSGPEGTYDLITAHYIHLPAEERISLHQRLAAAVNPGGTLLIVAHDKSDMENSGHQAPMPGLMFTIDDVVQSLPRDEWTVVTADRRPRQKDDGIHMHDSVIRVQRR
jgi:2-polyprenyl-3-methyl-5-hydroxy-6-metoxy-1,4-benzoquinol methylase